MFKHQDELLNAITELEKYDIVRLDSDDISSYITQDLSSLSIDYIVKNVNTKNPDYSGFIEHNDSLVIFINRSGIKGESERRIIYDFTKIPRNFGNEIINGASYKVKQLDKRWYYSEFRVD